MPIADDVAHPDPKSADAEGRDDAALREPPLDHRDAPSEAQLSESAQRAETSPEPGSGAPQAQGGGPHDDLFVGLVGAAGTDLPWVQEILSRHLATLGFVTEEISLSELIDREYGGTLPPRDGISYDEYVTNRMTAGNELRHLWREAEAVARLAIEEVRRRRDARGDDPPTCAFILRSLKRPEEVRLLQNVYRGQFVLIGCHTPREIRIRQLANEIARKRSSSDLRPHLAKAEQLADRDEHERGLVTTEPEKRKYFKLFGQSVEETFPLADAYVNLQRPAVAREQLTRFCDLLLGSPFISPSKDEVAMFHASAAAVRSTDLSRQVGAAITTPNGDDIIAVGCNEVPRAGGGAYWEGDEDDARDFRLGIDGNQDQRDRAMREVFAVLRSKRLLSDEALSAGPQAFEKALEDTRVDALTEFTRATHAEMAALLAAARRGTSVVGGVLYSTTFPCHNCAKHIVTAGVARVVFIEPYPKSLAEQLHGDALEVDEPYACAPKVRFEHFAGVAPVNYFAPFEASAKRKDESGRPLAFSARTISPKLAQNFRADLYPFEEEAIETLRVLRETRGSPTIEMIATAPQITDDEIPITGRA
jgi:deoxycytidylate deaminase